MTAVTQWTSRAAQGVPGSVPAASGSLPWGLALFMPAGLYLGTVLLAGPRLTPDGYDGVGFVLALDRFDLARFQPQPPGYPLFVLLGRMLHRLGFVPVSALSAVNALLLGGGIAAMAALLRRMAGARAGWLGLFLLAVSPLCWALGTSTLSDGAGLGAVLLAVAAASMGQLLGGGVLFALALGLRPSYLPLALPLLWLLWRHRGWRGAGTAAAGALGGVLLWLVPLLAIVGPWEFVALSLHHLHGHVYEFGGTLASDPAVGARLAALGHGLLHGALGPVWPAALVCLLCMARGHSDALVRGLLLVLLCWGLWVLLAQPVRGPGRHLLPATVALLMWMSAVLGQALDHRALDRPAQARLLLLLSAALVLAVALPAARAVLALRTQPSAGAQMARFIAANFPPNTPLYGAKAARYLDWLAGAGTARPARYLGEVIVDLEHRDRPPSSVLITSEVQAAPRSAARLRTLGHFCPPAAVPAFLQLDGTQQGGAPCIDLQTYQVFP